MSRILGSLGVVVLLFAVSQSMGCPPTGGDDAYTLTVTGNSDSGYHVEDKRDYYQVLFGGSIRWNVVNRADKQESIQVQLRDWEVMSNNDCAVHFTSGGDPGACSASWANIPNGETRPIAAEPAANSQSDSANPYMFNVWVGRAGGQPHKMDPELEIERFLTTPTVIVTALLGLLLIGVSLGMRRKTRA